MGKMMNIHGYVSIRIYIYECVHFIAHTVACVAPRHSASGLLFAVPRRRSFASVPSPPFPRSLSLTRGRGGGEGVIGGRFAELAC